MKKEKAYGYIKMLILEGKWDIEMAINVNEIAEDLKMSRTPIHKALTQLEQEGFLTIIPQVGVFVKRPEYTEIYERLLVCATLDALMTEQASLKISETKLNYLQDLLIKMDSPQISSDEYAQFNIEFHRTIYVSSEMEHTIKMTKQHWDYLNYVGTPDMLFSDRKRMRSQIEHWMIYQTLKERDSKLAKELMEKHMRHVADSLGQKYGLTTQRQWENSESNSNPKIESY